MDILVKAGQLLLSLTILVTLHEFGHLFFAKLFKTRVEKFYSFFDAWFAIIRIKKVNGKLRFKFFDRGQSSYEAILDENGNPVLDSKGQRKYKEIDTDVLPDDDWRKYPDNTEYGIGWLPLGGYVKISGMIDESMDVEQMKKEPQAWEFRSKPAWQRLIIMLGGIFVNVVLAWVIIAGIYSIYGNSYLSTEEIQKDGTIFNWAAKEAGFQDGDKIISIDGEKANKQFNRLLTDVILSDEVIVDRNGQNVKIHLTDEQIKNLIPNFKSAGMFAQPKSFKGVIIDSILPNSNALKAGLKKEDIIINLDGKPLNFISDLNKILSENKNKTLPLTISRKNEILNLQATVSDSATLGFGFKLHPFNDYSVKEKYDNFFTAFIPSVNESFTMLGYNVKQFKILFKPKTKAYEGLMGPIGMARNLFPSTWNWEFFWSITAMLSMWLAFFNILPIPGLDGGHALLTIIEMFTGKKLSDKAMEVVQTIGLVIILGLTILIFGKDIYDLIMK